MVPAVGGEEEAERHRASWRPSSADREREGRGVGGVWRGGEGVGAWHLGSSGGGGGGMEGGFSAGKRRLVSLPISFPVCIFISVSLSPL